MSSPPDVPPAPPPTSTVHPERVDRRGLDPVDLLHEYHKEQTARLDAQVSRIDACRSDIDRLLGERIGAKRYAFLVPLILSPILGALVAWIAAGQMISTSP